MIAVVILPRVLAAGASSQMSEVLSFCFRERAEPPSIKISVLTFLVEKKDREDFPSVYFLEDAISSPESSSSSNLKTRK